MSTRAQPLRSRIKEATNQEILQAAESVLAKEGVQATTMAKVAKQAGVAVGTLYNYFEDRDELLMVLYRTRRQQFFELLTAVIDESKGEAFAPRLERIVRTYVEQYESHRDFMKILFSGELPMTLGGGRPPLVDFAARLAPLFKDGIKERALRPGDVNFYAVSLASILRGMAIMTLHEKRPFGELAPLVTSLFLNGVGGRT